MDLRVDCKNYARKKSHSKKGGFYGGMRQINFYGTAQ